MSNFFLKCALLFSFVGVSACASGGSVLPTIAYSLNGPQLAIVGEYESMALEGEMDRSCMVGIGAITIYSKDREKGLMCEGKLNAEPSEKGRVRGVLDCTGGQVLAFTLRNLGPDQGVGLGRLIDASDSMIIFFHASKEEAERRFPEVKQEIAQAQQAVSKI